MRRVLIVAAAGCSFQVSATPTGDARFDATDDVAGDVAPDAPLTWSQPVPVGVTAGADDPTLTADLLELYFDAGGDIHVARRATATAPWGAPAVVATLSTNSIETTPEVSPDGLAMMFASNRPGSMGNTDVFASTRATRAAPWTAPVIVSSLNSPFSETGPVTSLDRLTIAFTSVRNGGPDPDLYLATRASLQATWGSALELAQLNTDGHEGSAFLSGDALRLCFDSDRSGDHDLYCSRRASTADPFGPPEALPSPINTAAGEEDPWFSPDGRHLYFYSDRDGMPGLWQATLE